MLVDINGWIDKIDSDDMKKILVLTDFSESARNAIFYAMKAFPPGQSEYIMLNRFDRIYTPSIVKESLSEIMENESHGLLDKEEALIREISGVDIIFEKISYLGFLSDAVRDITKTHDPDLVVMGTKGASSLPEKIIGTNASSLVKAINVPLLIVPENAVFSGLKDVVIAADPEVLHKAEHLDPVSEITHSAGSKITVLNVVDDGQPTDYADTPDGKRLKEHFKDNELSFVFVKDPHTEHAIVHFVHEQPCDLLVAVEHTRQFIFDLFHQSVTKRLVLQSDVPVLVLHG